MSLRRDIHAAVDEVAPPAPALASQVVACVLAYKKAHRAGLRGGRGARTGSLRGALTMVAASLIVVLMAALVVGPRVWRDWYVSVSRPPAINKAELRKLEARPLLPLPPFTAGEECPEGPFTKPPPDSHLGPVRLYGNGPAYIVEISGRGAPALHTIWGTYVWVAYAVPSGYSGLVLIRARDLQDSQRTVFVAGTPDYPGAWTATGELVGADTVMDQRIQQFTELALDAGRMHATLPGWWPITKSTMQGFAQGGSGCIVYQVDGADFTEVFVAYFG